MEEFEIKFLDIDVPAFEEKLLSIGAKKVGEYNYSRALFDHPDLRLNDVNSWVRLRTDGQHTTLTYKKRLGASLEVGASDEGMIEIEVSVGDYDKTHDILKSIGLIVKREEKNNRIRYQKGDVVYDIDFWPNIPPYVEIESTSLEGAQNAARELGFDPKDGMICSPKQVYAKYGIDIAEYSLVSFEKMIKSTVAL